MGGFWNDFFERLDLGGFWNDFFEMFGQNAKKAKNAQSAPKNHKYQRPAKKRHRSQICRTAKGGRAAVLPPGGFQLNPLIRITPVHVPHFASSHREAYMQ